MQRDEGQRRECTEAAARLPAVGAVVRVGVGETMRQVTGVYDGVIAYRETTAADQAAAQWGMWRETGITFCAVAEWMQWAAQAAAEA